MSHLQFCCASFLAQQNCKCDMTWRVVRVFNSRATIFPNRGLLYSVQLCWQNAERWLVSCHRCFFVLLLFAVHARLFCLIYFNLFNLFNLEMEWSDVSKRKLVIIISSSESLEAMFMRQSRSMQLYRATLLHSCTTKLRDKIAGVTLFL